jgi:hypothetical protein
MMSNLKNKKSDNAQEKKLENRVLLLGSFATFSVAVPANQLPVI